MAFAPATKEKCKLKMAITGPAKSGKTFTALTLMREIVGPEGKIAVIDTEHGSASKYADIFKFDVQEPQSFHPASLAKLIDEAVEGGYDGLIIDSLSHEWDGLGGCLESADQLAKQSKSQNSYFAWGDVTPAHNAFLNTMVRAPLHVIATMRVKTDYVLTEYSDNGKTKTRPVRVGLAPIQRHSVEYEFDVLMDMDKGRGYIDHTSRCSALQYLAVDHPGAELAGVLKAWLEGGAVPASVASLVPGPEKKEVMTKVGAPPKPAVNKPEARPEVPKPVAGSVAPPKPMAPAPSVPKPSLPQQPVASLPANARTPIVPAPKPAVPASATPPLNRVPIVPPKPTVAAPAPTPTQTSVAVAPKTDDTPAGKAGCLKLLEAGEAAGWTRTQMTKWINGQYPQVKDFLKDLTVSHAAAAVEHFTNNKP